MSDPEPCRMKHTEDPEEQRGWCPEPCRMKHTEDPEEQRGWCLFFIHSWCWRTFMFMYLRSSKYLRLFQPYTFWALIFTGTSPYLYLICTALLLIYSSHNSILVAFYTVSSISDWILWFHPVFCISGIKCSTCYLQ